MIPYDFSELDQARYDHDAVLVEEAACKVLEPMLVTGREPTVEQWARARVQAMHTVFGNDTEAKQDFVARCGGHR